MTPVYIVSSFHRSGSSMMMRCLKMGGLDAVYDSLADNMNIGAPEDYAPNPNGFYQYNRAITPDFYKENMGKLVKLYFAELPKLPVGYYKVIFMLRDPVEIRASMARWTPYRSWGIQEAATYLYDDIKRAILKIPNLDIVFINYADVISDPCNEFLKIRNSGVPVHVESALKGVDPLMYRLRMENK